MLTDRFGIRMLNPTIADGREWCCKWDNGKPRPIASVNPDCEDPFFYLRGNAGTLAIDGHGIARMSGNTPRMYVYDPAKRMLWQNVEVTFYARRVEETRWTGTQGFIVGARSEHQAYAQNPCNARTYYGRLLYDGRVHFVKELWHPHDRDADIYTPPRGEPIATVPWKPPEPQLPTGEWVGVKFVIRNIVGTEHVLLELYRDRSGGIGSGQWEPLIHYKDTGDWRRDDAPCQHPPNQVFREPATAVFIRNDALVAADYARFSIREIAPAEHDSVPA